MIYIFVFILLLYPVVKYDLMAKTGGENKWYYLNLFVLVLLAGLRYRVGGDTLMYMGMYNEMPSIDELSYFDFDSALYNPLWYIYCSIPRSISEEFWVFQIIQAIIVNSVFFHFFRKYSPKYYFSVILLYYIGYYCYFNMEILREVLCICILMLMTSWLFNGKLRYYYLGCVVALFIHYSAIIMLLFPLFITFMKKRSWKWQIILLLSVILLTLVVNLPILILSLLDVSETLTRLIEKYLDDQRSFMGMVFQLLQYLPVLGMIYIRRKFSSDDKRIVPCDFTPVVSVVVIVYAMSMCFEGFSRTINYFIPFVLVYIVHTIYAFVSNFRFKSNQITYIMMGFSLMLLSFNYYYYYMRDMSAFFPNARFKVIFTPYYSILDPSISEERERFIENYRDVGIFF